MAAPQVRLDEPYHHHDPHKEGVVSHRSEGEYFAVVRLHAEDCLGTYQVDGAHRDVRAEGANGEEEG